MKMLVIRSSRIEHLRAAIQRLKQRYPDAEIDLLTPRSAGIDPQEVSHLIECEEGALGPWSVRNIKSYDAVVILLNNPAGNGYRDVHRLARKFGASKYIIDVVTGRQFEQSPASHLLRIYFKTPVLWMRRIAIFAAAIPILALMSLFFGVTRLLRSRGRPTTESRIIE